MFCLHEQISAKESTVIIMWPELQKSWPSLFRDHHLSIISTQNIFFYFYSFDFQSKEEKKNGKHRDFFVDLQRQSCAVCDIQRQKNPHHIHSHSYETAVTIRRLKKMFGFKTENRNSCYLVLSNDFDDVEWDKKAIFVNNLWPTSF